MDYTQNTIKVKNELAYLLRGYYHYKYMQSKSLFRLEPKVDLIDFMRWLESQEDYGLHTSR